MKKEQSFVPLDRELLKLSCVTSKHRVSDEGELCKLQLSWTIKIVYVYMLDRFVFFKTLNKEYFDNQDDIASALALSPRTICTVVKELAAVGLLVVKAKRIQGAMHSNTYIVNDLFDKSLFIVDSVQEQSVISAKSKKSKQPVKSTEPPKKKPVFIDFEEETPF